MSLVGTRPPTVEEVAQYEEHHRTRLVERPKTNEQPYVLVYMWTKDMRTVNHAKMYVIIACTLKENAWVT